MNNIMGKYQANDMCYSFTSCCETTDFPTLLYSSTCDIATFYIPKALKRYPFRAEPPCIGHCREYPPPPRLFHLSFENVPKLLYHLV